MNQNLVKENILDAIRKIGDITIDSYYANLPRTIVYALAVNNYNEKVINLKKTHDLKKKLSEVRTIENTTEDQLNCIAVNFLRHICTPYDEIMDAIDSGETEYEDLNVLRRTVYQVIATAYPFLAVECEQQAAKRGIYDLWEYRMI